MTHTRKASFDDVLREIDLRPADQRFHYPIRHGSMRAGVYAPQGEDDQTPHQQDELYIISQGSGYFELAGERMTVTAGDLLFVKAGEAHRFLDFTADFATFVVFWGGIGGEREAQTTG